MATRLGSGALNRKTGMVNPQTRWIGAEHPFELHEAYIRFRKSIHLESACTGARLLISGNRRLSVMYYSLTEDLVIDIFDRKSDVHSQRPAGGLLTQTDIAELNHRFGRSQYEEML